MQGIQPAVIAELPGWARPLVKASQGARENISAAVQLASTYGTRLPQPDGGQTMRRWRGSVRGGGTQPNGGLGAGSTRRCARHPFRGGQARAQAALCTGIVDAALCASGTALGHAAPLVDEGEAQGTAGDLLGLRVRAVVADPAERTIRQVGHVLGPAPLAFDEEQARRVADLELYVRQHHAERDLSRLGSVSRAAQPDEGIG